MSFPDLDLRLLEGILYASSEPVSVEELASAFALDTSTVSELMDELGSLLDIRNSALELRRVGRGFRIYTRPELAEGVGHFANRSRIGRLSKAALETLAIVAYRQPISRGEVSRIRGVVADSPLRTLAERGLIDEVGRDPGPGRAPLYGTTDLFLEKIGLESLSELTPLAEFAPDAEAAAELERILGAASVDADV